MKILWSDRAWEDSLTWQKTDPDTLARVNALIKEVRRTPFTGLGKPEPLRGNLKGWWPRRITDTHSLVCRVGGRDADQTIEIAQCRRHHE